MLFLNDLYHIEKSGRDGESHVFSLSLNPEHVIYRAHFPDMPITPGVCILQMGVELLGVSVGKALELTYVKNMKFLNILTPDAGRVDVRIHHLTSEETSVRAQIDMDAEGKSIAKMSVVCQMSAQH